MLRAAFRRLLPFVCLVSALVTPAYSRVRFWAYAEQGGKTVQTGGVSSTLPRVQGSYPQSTVTVTYTTAAGGRVSTSGTTVTLLAGTSFNANGQWNGLTMTVNSVAYTIVSCASATVCTLNMSAGTQTSVVYSMPSNAPVAIFSDNAGTAKSNPFTSDINAYLFFYADDGTYTITISGSGVSTPFSFAADSGIDPFLTYPSGNPVPISTVIEACGTDLGYLLQVNGLAAAFANIPSGGCLNVFGHWSLTTGIVTNTSNITINYMPGSQVIAGANSITLNRFGGDRQTVRGGYFTANSRSNIIGVFASPGASNFTATDNVFTGNNTYSSGMQGICLVNCSGTGTPSTGFYLARNRHINTYQGDIGFEVDQVTFEDESYTGLTGDGFFLDSEYTDFTTGASWKVSGMNCQQEHRYCGEIVTNGVAGLQISNFYCGLSDGSGCISGGSNPFNLNQNVGGSVGPGVVNASGSSVGGGNYGMELFFAKNLHIHHVDIASTLDLIHGFVIGGYGLTLDHLSITGVGLPTNGNGVIYEGSYASVGIDADNVFSEITCVNVATACLGGIGAPGDIYDKIHDFRAMCAFTSDKSPGVAYVGVNKGFQLPPYRPVAITNSNFELLPPVNGCVMSAPGSFTWNPLHSNDAAPTPWVNNRVTNQNATAFGRVFTASQVGNLQTNETGNIYANLSSIHQPGLNPPLGWCNNFSLIGVGSGSPPTDFSTIQGCPIPAGTKPTCVTGNAVDGVGGVSCTADEVGGAYNFALDVITSGTPAAPNSVIAEFTEAAGAFNAAPQCTATWKYTNTTVGELLVRGNSATDIIVVLVGGSALTTASEYKINIVCPYGQ